ncbi:MAG TPA: hypothetical protein VET23_13710 [Chitinophagaceae bacterium]|nr:hypothetical protein [Chitinophagaceae bacterium]
MKRFEKISIIIAFVISLYGLSACGTPSYLTYGTHYSNPGLTPPYYSGVRYYYLPDIEAYYDLSDDEFVYLNNGQWLFSLVLPSIYGSYDLYNGFVIALNVGVYQPWLHHQYYVSHYSRYYYYNYYSNMDINSIRGFNENDRKPILWKQEDRNRINDLRKNEKFDRKAVDPKPPQKPNYYGKDIGQPVKVKPQMKENKSKKKGHEGPQ